MLENVNYDDYEADGTGKDQVQDKRKSLYVGRVQEESSVSDRTLMTLGAVSTAVVAAGWLARNSQYLQRLRIRA